MQSFQRFCTTSLSRSRIIFTGECASTIQPASANTAILRLLVEEFHRPSGAAEYPLATSMSAPPPPTNAADACKLRVLTESDRRGGSSKKYAVVFVATSTEMLNNGEMRQLQLANMACSGVCSVAVVIAPDLAQNAAALLNLRSIEGVEVIDVNLKFADQNASSVTPQEFCDAVSGRLWSFIARSRVACGPLTVHCWGDSLTEGYTFVNNRLSFTPYSDYLMEDVLPNRGMSSSTDDHSLSSPSFAIPCINYGVSGETTEQIRARFEYDMKHAASSSRSSDNMMKAGDIAVFLGGTNDLGISGTPETAGQQALVNMTAMVEAACKLGMRCVIVSIPSTAHNVTKNAFYDARNTYNAGLKQLAASSGAEYIDFFTVSSVEMQTPDGETVRKLRPDIAADNLHLTEGGYALLAREIGSAIRNILMHLRARSTTRG